LIATFERQQSLYPVIGPIGFHSLSESLLSSQNFTFNGQTFNFNCISPDGTTFAQFLSSTPIPGAEFGDYTAVYAGADAVTAVGSKLSVVGQVGFTSSTNRFAHQRCPLNTTESTPRVPITYSVANARTTAARTPEGIWGRLALHVVPPARFFVPTFTESASQSGSDLWQPRERLLCGALGDA